MNTCKKFNLAYIYIMIMEESFKAAVNKLTAIGSILIVSGFVITGMYGAVIAASGAGLIAGNLIGSQMDGASGTIVGGVGGWLGAMTVGWILRGTLGGLIGGVVGAFIGMFVGGVMEGLKAEEDADWFPGAAGGGICGVLGGLFAISYIGNGIIGGFGLIMGGGIGAIVFGSIGSKRPAAGIGSLIGAVGGMYFESVIAVAIAFSIGSFVGFLLEKL